MIAERLIVRERRAEARCAYRGDERHRGDRHHDARGARRAVVAALGVARVVGLSLAVAAGRRTMMVRGHLRQRRRGHARRGRRERQAQGELQTRDERKEARPAAAEHGHDLVVSGSGVKLSHMSCD